MRLFLTALGALAGAAAWASSGGAQIKAASADKPVYTNGEYAFSVRIPPGVTYERDEPPNPDHGFAVSLPNSEKLWVDASPTENASVSTEVKRIVEGCRLEEKRPALLNGHKAVMLQVQCPATQYDVAYEERVLLAEVNQRHRSPILYQVALRTDKGINSAAGKKLFAQVVSSFRFRSSACGSG